MDRQNFNQIEYVSPEEMARIAKAKEDIKGFYMNFFRNCTLKKE